MRSVYGKIDKLLSYWSNEYPHVLCHIEHHLHEQEINKPFSSPFILVANYCRNKLIPKSNNKSKSIWSILNNVTGKCNNACDPPPLIMEGTKCNDGQNIAKVFKFIF
jgi:hypothetical protein